MTVGGTITRQFQAQPLMSRGLRLLAAHTLVAEGHARSLNSGHRIHLHRLGETVPLELDPGSFAFRGPRRHPTSSLLELRTWVRELAGQARHDDGFRHLTPALAPELPPTGLAAVAGSLRASSLASTDRESSPILDNLSQFRFYSGWVAAVERRGQQGG